MKRTLAGVVLALVLLATVLFARALTLPSRQLAREPVAPSALEIEAGAAAEHLAAALRFRTISHQDPEQFPIQEFDGFQAWLEETYPALHETLGRERVSETHTLLYTWSGSDASLDPVILMAHQDVVPPGPDDGWAVPPFEGVRSDGFVWGRGAMDDKGSLVAICEAVEHLLGKGFVPTRTVLLSFGHDEEVGGPHGAVAVAKLLDSRGVRGALVLDEGLAVLDGIIPGVSTRVAMIGVAEKGYMTLELEVKAAGGHSSTPPPHTALGILASAIHRLEAKPLPGGVTGVTETFLRFLAPELPFVMRVPLANLWLFEGVLARFASGDAAVNALLRTTTAVTMAEASMKENVLPSVATAKVNFRLRPGDTSKFVTEFVRDAIDDPRVAIHHDRPPLEASPVSPVDGPAFRLLQRTIGEVFPEAIVSPGLVLGGTDARHMTPIAEDIFRFGPFVYEPSDLSRTHGFDERMSEKRLGRAIGFYAQLIRNSSGAAGGDWD